jgi:hypothetical protein
MEAGPSNDVRRCRASFTYEAGSWSKPRRAIAKVEWYLGELYPRAGLIVTNMARPPRMSSPSTTWPLRRIPDGRGRHSAKSVCRHPAADRGTAAAARYIDSARGSIVMRSLQLTGEVRLDERKFDMSRL